MQSTLRWTKLNTNLNTTFPFELSKFHLLKMTEVCKGSRTASKCALWFGGEISFFLSTTVSKDKNQLSIPNFELTWQRTPWKIQPFFKALHFHTNWVTPHAEQDHVDFIKINIGIKSKKNPVVVYKIWFHQKICARQPTLKEPWFPQHGGLVETHFSSEIKNTPFSNDIQSRSWHFSAGH